MIRNAAMNVSGCPAAVAMKAAILLNVWRIRP
jgi:hypothetical protein